MEITPLTRLARHLRDKVVSWRPVVTDTSADHSAREPRDVSWPSFGDPRQVIIALGWITLGVVSLVLGSGLKNWAHTGLTIGHEDYRLLPADRLYALNTLRQQAIDDGASLAMSTRTVYPACHIEDEDEDETTP